MMMFRWFISVMLPSCSVWCFLGESCQAESTQRGTRIALQLGILLQKGALLVTVLFSKPLQVKAEKLVLDQTIRYYIEIETHLKEKRLRLLLNLCSLQHLPGSTNIFVWEYHKVAECFWSHKVTSEKLLGAQPYSLHSSLCLFHWIYNHPSFVATEQKSVLYRADSKVEDGC